MAQEHNQSLAEQLDRFEQDSRKQGLRVTQQRLEIFKELARSQAHPSAEEVFNRVRRRLRTISLDTVYRTIATFESHGLIRRVQVLDNKSRFDTNLQRHHHFVCLRCQRIEDFYWPDFDRMDPPAVVGELGVIDSRHAELRGVCSDCRRKLGS
jgi:Fur family peroxide stress response transcriptional regulator